MRSTIKTTTAEDTHMPRLVSRSLTPSRTKTTIRHHPTMCCFASIVSIRLFSSSRPSKFTLFLVDRFYVYLFSPSLSVSIELLVSLLLSSSFSLPRFLSLLQCNISWLCLCFCSLEWEIVLFVHLCCVFLENGCKDSRNVEINNKYVYPSRCYLLIHLLLPGTGSSESG